MKGGAQRPGGSWLQQNYDKLALVVALVLLLGSAVLLVLRIGDHRKEFNARIGREVGQEGQTAEGINLAPVSNLFARIAEPIQVPQASKRMMVGDLRVASIPAGAPIPFDAAIDPFTRAEQPSVDFDPDSDGDGIPDSIEVKWGMNPFDPSDALADLDGDGYSNLEEFLAGTDPRDANSFPPPHAKLRLVRTITNPFRFVFAGVSGERYQLNTLRGDRTYFKELGEEVEGFKLEAFRADAPGGPTLVLKRGTETYRLVQGRQINDEARTAFLVFLVDGSRFRVRARDPIRLRDVQYNVVDIREDRIVIRDAQDGKLSTIGLLTPEERNRLVGGAAAPVETDASAFPFPP
ncbi:MAG TPA: thrombospondin type 3 repeat-containing protein [Kiritimatiellia bacterium]|nr:thrombospondin type 3 repeat-containing protein [Kiritimatiellia bacterium]